MKVKFRDIEIEYRGREAIEVPFPQGKKIWKYKVQSREVTNLDIFSSTIRSDIMKKE